MTFIRTVEKQRDVAKAFQYGVEMNGFDFGLCDNVKISEFELSGLEIGNGAYKFKVPGQRQPQTVVIKQMTSQASPDNGFLQNLIAVQGGLITSTKIYTFFIKLYGENLQVLKKWQVVDAWVGKVTIPELGDDQDEIYMEEIELNPRKILPLVI